MPFLVGSDVAVVGFRQHGRILDVLPGNRYRIAMGGLTMVCREGQLETVSHSKKKQRRERDAPAQDAGSATPASSAPAADSSRFQSIDLHGMTVPEALAALPIFLDRAIRADLPSVEVIHGVGGGRLRAAVRRYLAEVPAVAAAAPDDRNPGVTVAYFSGRQSGSLRLRSR
jgi:DNA mismatch repair protein MutS2